MPLQRVRHGTHTVTAHGLPRTRRQQGPDPHSAAPAPLSAESGPATESLPSGQPNSPSVVTPTGVPAADAATILLWQCQPTAPCSHRSPAKLAPVRSAGLRPCKGCALAIIGRLSWHVRMLTSRRKSPEAIHRAWRPTASSDLSVLVRTCVADQRSRQGSSRVPLTSSLPTISSTNPTVLGDAWERLGAAGGAYPTLSATCASSQRLGCPDELSTRPGLHVAAGRLKHTSTWGPSRGGADDSRAPTMAWKLFIRHDSARCSRPTRSARAPGRASWRPNTRSLLAPDWQTASKAGMRASFRCVLKVMASQ